jgi:hypothetical protein
MLNRISACYHFVRTLFASIWSGAKSAVVPVVLLVALTLAKTAFATDFVRRVDVTASAGGDGTSWTSAYRVLQDAIAWALDQTSGPSNTDTVEIRIAGGIYYPDRFDDSTMGTNDRSASFHLLQRVSMKGQYRGLSATGQQDPNERVATIITYLDIGTANDNSDNSCHVVFADDPDISVQNCLLDGFTIRNGYADGGATGEDQGGGMYLSQAHPKIRNCIITNNYAATLGGGVRCVNHAEPPEFRNCKFLKNSVVGTHGNGTGGVKFVDASQRILQRCRQNVHFDVV